MSGDQSAQRIGEPPLTRRRRPKYGSPADLAEAVRRGLWVRGGSDDAINRDVLVDLFQTLWAVSLRTEEGAAVSVQLVFLDPANSDPHPPERIVADRWSVIPLADPIPAEVEAIVKLAGAADPRSSSLAVHEADGFLAVWGLVDQANRSFDYLNYDSQSGPLPPGTFHARIEAPGHLSAWIGYDKIAELHVNQLVGAPIDVLFAAGPIRQALNPGLERHLEKVRTTIPSDVYDKRGHWDSSLARDWTSTLCRILLRARNYRHGGALLLTPDESESHLNVKYDIRYGRLSSALARQGQTQIAHTNASDNVYSGFLDDDTDDLPDELPVLLHLDEAVTKSELDDLESELDGTIWFISLLTRVDGLVLMTPDLEVRGFGVEITAKGEPDRITRAVDAARTRIVEIDYNHYGTRHRSMMRYCAAVPGSVGFVISQDGDVRVMTSVEGCLTMWDNVRLQSNNFGLVPPDPEEEELLEDEL